ncbi:MAG: 23S rRNA (pseudouridine(1915)-N(3))-methyltransferase RlmH [Candidatus Peregrinibacteria bacterium]
MHRITLLSVGKVKTTCFAEGCDLYTERLKKQCDFTERILSPGTKEEENDRILKALEKAEGTIVVLSHTGKEHSSEELAAWIGKKRDIGSPISFVICGAYGADERVIAKAHLVFSLSRMTFPHELCKLLFLEQLYRAQEIARGSGYHH